MGKIRNIPVYSGLKRRILLAYYKLCLKETNNLIIEGKTDLELSNRFFKYKIRELSKLK